MIICCKCGDDCGGDGDGVSMCLLCSMLADMDAQDRSEVLAIAIPRLSEEDLKLTERPSPVPAPTYTNGGVCHKCGAVIDTGCGDNKCQTCHEPLSASNEAYLNALIDNIIGRIPPLHDISGSMNG